ncbi:MAG TPA: PKD domain-containing protein [Solirubrobacteraceae bacterium]|nr:PKD domain-containing protein [Solirubrobacteraceae bacterium]
MNAVVRYRFLHTIATSRQSACWLVFRALALPAAVLALLLYVSAANAEISPVAAIDGPSSEIVDFGGAAMAPDGTGGIVYRRRVEGRVHIFVAQYVNGAWGEPQRVDVGERFDSSFPAIAAGEGGRLVVVWANHYSSTTDGLFSATMDPGSTGFQPPVPVDLNIGQATGTYPSIAMNLAGQALVSYRVITAVSGPSTPNIPPGYVLGEIRMARFDGQYWSSFGQPLNRDAGQPMPQPTATNSPQVAIDLTGQGLLAWQEPDDSFVNRIYARRIFGMVPGNLLDVSPTSYNGHALNGPADELSVDVAGFGQGAVAWRQEPAPGSGFTHARVFEAEIPSSFDPHGAAFGAARAVDGPPGADGPSTGIGDVSMAVDGKGGFDVGYGTGDQSFDTGGSETGVSKPLRLDNGSEVPGEPVLTRADDGALAAAWRVQVHGAGAVAVLERRSDGTPNRSLVAAPHGGAVHALAMGGSHRGDAIFGFLQGDGPNAQIAAVVVRSPPGEFVTSAPSSWVRSAKIPFQWEVPLAGAGAISYAVLVDDQEVAENVSGDEYTLTRSQIADGVHTVQVEATDSLGQVVDSVPATMKVDRTPPHSRLRVRGSSLTVTVIDGAKGQCSGVRAGSVKVQFGDGSSGHGRIVLRHRYARTGTYVVTITAADKIGNRRTVRKRVRVG